MDDAPPIQELLDLAHELARRSWDEVVEHPATTVFENLEVIVGPVLSVSRLADGSLVFEATEPVAFPSMRAEDGIVAVRSKLSTRLEKTRGILNVAVVLDILGTVRVERALW